MANGSNGEEVARGRYQNYSLLPPFDEVVNGFNCTGLPIVKLINIYIVV